METSRCNKVRAKPRKSAFLQSTLPQRRGSPVDLGAAHEGPSFIRTIPSVLESHQFMPSSVTRSKQEVYTRRRYRRTHIRLVDFAAQCCVTTDRELAQTDLVLVRRTSTSTSHIKPCLTLPRRNLPNNFMRNSWSCKLIIRQLATEINRGTDRPPAAASAHPDKRKKRNHG